MLLTVDTIIPIKAANLGCKNQGLNEWENHRIFFFLKQKNKNYK